MLGMREPDAYAFCVFQRPYRKENEGKGEEQRRATAEGPHQQKGNEAT